MTFEMGICMMSKNKFRKRPVVGVRMDNETRALLVSLCNQYGVSQSALVEAALTALPSHQDFPMQLHSWLPEGRWRQERESRWCAP